MNERFNLLIVQPCKKETSEPFAILLDALDECEQAQEFSAAIKNLWSNFCLYLDLQLLSKMILKDSLHYYYRPRTSKIERI